MSDDQVEVVELPEGAEPLRMLYRNYKGEVRVREVVPQGPIYWGSNEWHKEPQWLMRVNDVTDPRNAGEGHRIRDFAISGILEFHN